MTRTDTVFAGSIPELYARHMVPMIFEPYAIDLAARVSVRQPSRLLEIAAGTGVVTRQLANTLPPAVAIVATDLNQPMLDHAAKTGTSRPVEWRQADALQLPFADGAFDLVVCQFGAMFFPDKAKAYSEAKRVLRPGGTFLFNVWDCLEENEFTDTVCQALAAAFPEDPPCFMSRVPHGYFDTTVIARDLASGGFTRTPELTTLALRSRAQTARIPAMALCQGTPLRNEIEARDASRLEEVTELATEAMARRFGAGPVEGRIQAHVVAVER